MQFKTFDVTDKIINQYLFYKNLQININRGKKRIKKIDHYLWWLGKQKNRKSFFISKNNKLIFISTADHIYYKKFKIIYSGLLSCLPETNLFDILKAIQIQNKYLDKQKGKYCFISIDRRNKVLLKHWKYFKYTKLSKKDKFFSIIKKCVNITPNSNIYFKKI